MMIPITLRPTADPVTDRDRMTEAETAAALGTKVASLSIEPDNNDFCFVQVPTDGDTPTEMARVDRYKYNGTAWSFEFSLNNSGFTSAQWEAINSGITTGHVGKLDALPTKEELDELLDAKQDNLTFASIATCEALVDELT